MDFYGSHFITEMFHPNSALPQGIFSRPSDPTPGGVGGGGIVGVLHAGRAGVVQPEDVGVLCDPDPKLARLSDDLIGFNRVSIGFQWDFNGVSMGFQ